MFYGETGNEIDRLWRTVADGVIRGTIPTIFAKVSAARNDTDKHVICIYNDNFLNEADVFALRDGIRNAGIEKPLKYKANIFTHLGIDRQNKWGIDPVLYRDEKNPFESLIDLLYDKEAIKSAKHDEQCPTLKRSKKSCGTKITKTSARRDERRQYESLFNLGYDRKASKSAVAGITLKRKSSTILSISGPSKKSRNPITLGIKAISPIIKYGGDHDVRISVLFHDGNTCLRGVAFGAAAQKLETKLKVGSTYKFMYYTIKVSDRKYSNTKYMLYLRENTTIKTIEKGYGEIPKEKGKKISEMNDKFKNLLVSTLKVRISKIGELFRPKNKFLRDVNVSDETGEMKILMWSYDGDEFPYSVGDHVILRYMTVKYDDQRNCFLHKSDFTKIVRCKEKKKKHA